MLHLSAGTILERSYAVALGRNWAADKAVEGDEATPVGEFYICSKNPRSKFFLSMCLSYPNAEDAERGLAGGLITPAEHRDILAAVAALSIGHFAHPGRRHHPRDCLNSCLMLGGLYIYARGFGAPPAPFESAA